MEQNIEIKKTARHLDSWKKILIFLQEENSLQKNKLAQILKNNCEMDQEMLEIGEQYQSLFLQQDQALEIIRKDLVAFEKSAMRKTIRDHNYTKKPNQLDVEFEREIEIFEINFEKLKNEFSNFIESYSE